MVNAESSLSKCPCLLFVAVETMLARLEQEVRSLKAELDRVKKRECFPELTLGVGEQKDPKLGHV